MKKQLFFLFLILISFSCISAQTPFKVEYIGPNDGLSHRWAFDVHQDKEGFLWIATLDGLNRYDGHEFKVFRHDAADTTSLPDNRCWSLSEDASGQLLVNTPKNVSIYQATNNRFRFFEMGKDSLKIEKKGWSLLPDFHKHPAINVFLKALPRGAGWSHGFFEQKHANPKVDQPFAYSDLTRAVTIQQDSFIWIWSISHQYHRLNLQTDTWEHFKPFELNPFVQNKPLKPGHPEWPIDEAGRFWFPNLAPHPTTLFDFVQLPSSIPTTAWQAYIIDNKKNIWLHTNLDLYKYEMDTKELTSFGKLGNQVFNAYEDKEGIMWLARSAGLVKIFKPKKLFENYGNNPFELHEVPVNGANPLELAMGANRDVYFFHIKPPINEFGKFNSSTKRVHSVPLIHKDVKFSTAFPSARGRNVIGDTDEFIWFMHGHPFGVGQYNPTTRKYQFYRVPDEIKKRGVIQGAASTGKEKLYVKFLDKIYEFNKKTKAFTRIPALQNIIGILFHYRLEDNSLWIRNNKQSKLIKIDCNTFAKDTIHLVKGNKIKANLLFWKGFLWVGTQNGLQQYHPTTLSLIKTYDVNNGLPTNAIQSMLASDEALWLGTTNGLCRFEPFTSSVKTFNVEDGLPHYEFNANSVIKSKDGKFWMGTANGLTSFYPKILNQQSTTKSLLKWTYFKQYDAAKNEELVESILKMDTTASNWQQQYHRTLSSDITSFKIQFALNSFTNPSKNTYTWYLEGYENPWNHTSHTPIAEYQKVPAGKYTLRIRAKDYRGNAAANELAIPIAVLEVWYKQTWAKTIAGLIGIGLLFWGYQFQLSRTLEKEETRRIKELDVLKSRLYTNITHEFRTPLTVILGMSEQLQAESTQLNIAQQFKLSLLDKLKLVQRNGHNLLTLINQLLDLSKLESGKMDSQVLEGDIVQYIKYLLESFDSLAAGKNIKSHFSTTVPTLTCRYDQDKVHKIVTNLLSNAIKFTPEKGDIYTHLSYQNEIFSIQIRDTGIGIAAIKLHHIFDRFYQTDATSTRKQEGSGIGLALVKELVHFLQGTIEVESEKGKGTTFSIALPMKTVTNSTFTNHQNKHSQLLEQIHQEKKDTIKTKENPVVISSKDNNKEKLLLIEDNADVALYIQSILGNHYQISYAKNGQMGIEMAVELIPDIIISDVMMPEKDGFEVVDTLKNDTRTSHIPIILLTAKADMTSKLTGLKRGADAYLAKPFNREELFIRLEKLVTLRKALQQKYSQLPLTVTFPSIATEPTIEDLFLQKINTHIQENLDNPAFSIPDLCQRLAMSQSQLYRKIKALTNQSTVAYIRRFRLHQGKALLQNKDLTISEIAYQVGFTSMKYFSDAFVKEFGKRPSAFQNPQ